MLRNYLLTAWKVFMRRKLFTAINLLCIVLTLVVLMVIASLLAIGIGVERGAIGIGPAVGECQSGPSRHAVELRGSRPADAPRSQAHAAGLGELDVLAL